MTPDPATPTPRRQTTDMLPPAETGARLTKTPADSTVTLVHIMSDHDTNLYGTVHGGVIMKLVDDAASAVAARHAAGPAVTVSVDRMTFLIPARVGDILTVAAQIERVGRTSMDIGVQVSAERWDALGPATEIVTAYLTFVAIDATGKPRPVPDLVAVTPLDHERLANAHRRRAASHETPDQGSAPAR